MSVDGGASLVGATTTVVDVVVGVGTLTRPGGFVPPYADTAISAPSATAHTTTTT
ncbi:MAG TPA: hypothetical protein VM121_03130 [Acidimicrobiales bacterium]|nr:hypothetical protein [Acidimicrobiales bacterium]